MLKLENTLPLSNFLLAAQNGNLQVVKACLVEENGIANLFTPSCDERVSYGIHLAAENGQLPVVKYLVKLNHDMASMLDARCETPLFRAVANNHYDVAKFLIKSNLLILNIEQRNSSDKTLLLIAAEKGFLRIVKLLARFGADLAAISRQDDAMTAAHFACMNGHLQVLKFLLRKSPQLLHKRTCHDGTNLLHLACEYRHDKVASYLIKHTTIDVNAVGGIYGASVLFIAAGHCSLKIVKLLVERAGASLMLKSATGFNCLHFAVFHQKITTILYLIEKAPYLARMKGDFGEKLDPLQFAESLGLNEEAVFIKKQLERSLPNALR